MADPFSKYASGLQNADWGAAATAYNNSKARASQNYASAGFGPTVTSKYQRKVQAATYSAPNVDKAIRNYTAKMRS